jgi:hypothetical protein
MVCIDSGACIVIEILPVNRADKSIGVGSDTNLNEHTTYYVAMQ